jgi:hypothetical protein
MDTSWKVTPLTTRATRSSSPASTCTRYVVPHPTTYTPYADQPPVIRIPYVWFVDTETGEELAVVMLMGDKTGLNNDWYPAKVQQIELTQVPEWDKANPSHKARVRRTR